MARKEQLVRLYDQLNEADQKAAYEFVRSLARRKDCKAEDDNVLTLYGKNYFIVSD